MIDLEYLLKEIKIDTHTFILYAFSNYHR